MTFLLLERSWHKGWTGGVDSQNLPSVHIKIEGIVAVLTPVNEEANVSVYTKNGGEIVTPSRDVALFGREISLMQCFTGVSKGGIIRVAVDAISCVSPNSSHDNAMSLVEVSGGHKFFVTDPQSSIFAKITNDMR